MKKITLLLLVFCISLMVMAQQKRLEVPVSLKNKWVDAPVSIKDIFLPAKPMNQTTISKSSMEDILGSTVYDMQTNSSPSNHFYIHDDGTMAGVWTMGMVSSSFPERGTGYNLYNGAWGTAPTARIETVRAGWPSYAPLGPTGEIVVTHTDVSGLAVCLRPVKGTGAWTQSILAGPTGAVDISWPRVLTTGVNHNSVHIICNTWVAYQGLNLAILYYRSLDGGVNWDKKHVILPGMTSADCLGFAGDELAWASPKGDTIAFAVAGEWIDGFVMKSFDNGNTWTKTVFFNNPYKLTPATTVVPRFACLDGSIAVELDNLGKAHVAVGRMFANCDGTGATTGHKYYPGTDGLVYWNENMPVIDTTRLLDLDTLDAHGQLLGYVVANGNPNDTIIDFPAYGVGLSSFPQISIDNKHSIFVIWSGLTVGNPNPDNLNYRHIWSRKFNVSTSTWSDMVDFNSGIMSLYQEFVYPSMAKKIVDGNLKFIYQTSTTPGSAVKDATVAYHDNNIVSLNGGTWVGMDSRTTQKNSVMQNYPNPVKDYTHIRITLTASCEVTISVSNVAGISMMEISKGIVGAGNHDFTLDASHMAPGIYFYTVTMGSEKITKKMIVQ